MCHETGETMRFTSNCFLPNIYEFVTCIVKDLNFKFLNSQTLSVEAILNLKTNRTFDEIYFKDKWKKEENWMAFKHLYDYYPLFFIFTENKNKVYPLKTEVKLDNINPNFTDSNVHWNVGLPFSKVKTKKSRIRGPMGSMINHEEYIDGKGFSGPNYAIFSQQLKFNEDLQLKFVVLNQKIELNSNDLKYSFPIKLFFPFKKVIIENINYSAPPGFKINKKPTITLYNPYDEIKLDKTPIQPQNMDSLSYGSQNNIIFSNKLDLNSYKILELNFEYVPTINKEALAFVTTYPIPSSIYNSINKIHSEKFAPAIVKISNYSNETINASIIAEIQGISNIFEDDIVVGPYSQETVKITPTLKVDVIERLYDIMDTLMRIKVESNEKIILRSIEPIQVLARDTMIWELEEPGRSWAVNLSNLVVSWITPHSHDVDKIISDAARKNGTMGDFIRNNSVDDNLMENEIKAIYDTISEDIRYVNRPFSFGSTEHVSTQRILSPKQTLTERSGNCIDLTVLFASCLENIGIKPLVMLVPEHAFVGWKGSSQPHFLETTLMGTEDFFSAVKEGKEEYEEFSKPNQETMLIDVEKFRDKGIYPPTWFN